MMKIDVVEGYGQRLDPRVRLIMPWYTYGALDVLAARDFSGKTVFEWGGGCSTFWWSQYAAKVYTVEAHQPWTDWIAKTAQERGFTNIFVERRWPEPLDAYLALPDGCVPDIVCIDGSERTACLKKALTFPRPLTIIFDNWQQDLVYIDEEAEAMMAGYPGQFFVQADHTDHQGKPWQTAIWDLV